MKRRLQSSRIRQAIESLESRRLLALMHAWTFNDGTANDSVGTAHGTLMNGATVIDGWLTLNNGSTQSGANPQHAQLPAGIMPASGSASLVVWYTNSRLASTWTRVFDIGDQSGSNGNSYLFYTPRSGSNDARAALRPTGSTERVVSKSGGTYDGFSHMAAVVIDTDAGLLRLFVDGVQVATNALAGANAGSFNDSLAFLGRSLFNVDPGFTGGIDEFRIYDHALSADEVWTIHGDGATRSAPTTPAKQVEKLDRGIVVVRRSSTQAYIGWRLLGDDPAGVQFNLYRSANGGAAVKLNSTPITQTTDFVDSTVNFSATNDYFVRPIVNGVEGDASESFTLAANSPVRQFLNVPLQIPAGGTTPDDVSYTYSANDASVGDLDGDGQYEIILKWDPSNAKDNSQSGYTGNVYIDAYKLDGTLMWRIDLGKNIRAGAHYTQFIVYDLDGDGRAEVAMKTAPGTIDGTGTPVLLGTDNVNADYRNSGGYILTGPEYLTVFDGETGGNLATMPLEPARGSVTQWGDSYGNRVDRFTAAVAYLDGERPSLILGRGYYGPQSSSGQSRNEIAAYDFRGGALSLRWHFKAGYNINGNINSNYIGQGPHGMSVADVDGDGRDEIVYGAAVIDDDGLGLYSTGLGHGDAFHVGDLDPDRPGLEVFMVHESQSAYTSNGRNAGGEFRDAATGALIYGIPSTGDVGRGVSADIDPRYPGAESWATTSDPNGNPRQIWAANGTPVQNTPGNMMYNFVNWWDADPTRELLDGTTISDWTFSGTNPGGRTNFDLNPAVSGTQSAPNAASNNGTKSTPSLSADLFGDWREEVIWRRSDNTALMIFTTTIPAQNRMTTLMHDPQYRVAIAWQNGAYNQPPHPSFFVGDSMRTPPVPNVFTPAVDRVSPEIIESSFEFESFPQAVSIRFSEDVRPTVSRSMLSLLGPGGVTIEPVALRFDADTFTARFDFSTPLPDGDYTATLDPAGITDAAGNAISAGVSFDFFVLAGDATRNRVVDFEDLLVVARNFGRSDATFTEGDFNYDSEVGFSDLLILAKQFGRSPVVSPFATTTKVGSDRGETERASRGVLE